MHHPGLGAWMRKRRLKTPDKTALIYGDGAAMTYRQLADARRRSVARCCASRGHRQGRQRRVHRARTVPSSSRRCSACAQLGAVFVPDQHPPRAARDPPCARRLPARASLIHDPEFARRAAPLISAVRHRARHRDRRPDRRLAADLPAPPHAEVDAAPDDPAAIIYTSGTTGRAKGAVLTHQNLTWVALNCLVDYDVVSTDVALMISPLFHVASLGHGRAAGPPQGRHDRAREGLRARARARASSPSTASRC